jgi:16S rRNA (guanine527-N7)-methyltransferase
MRGGSAGEAEEPPVHQAALETLLEMLAEPGAPVSERSVERARQVHLADSLAALEVEQLRTADRIGDLGSGAGFPGLVLAAVLHSARVDLIESVNRKCGFLRTAIERMAVANASVICQRAEAWAAAAGCEAYDVVTARAIGRLAVVAELASPLLRDGGLLLAWKGRPNPDEEGQLVRAAPRLAMEPIEVRPVTPYPGSRNRHIHLLRKNGATPDELPRRIGLAAKRPFGTERQQPN